MSSGNKRLQFNFTPEALKEVDKLQQLTNLPNRAEVIRHALRCFQWIIEETANTATIMLEKNGTMRQVVFPFLVTKKQ